MEVTKVFWEPLLRPAQCHLKVLSHRVKIRLQNTLAMRHQQRQTTIAKEARMQVGSRQKPNS
mgnify:CR=1 FL=1